jgi:toxin-antitoxin system PIN domain toxin
MLVVDTNVLLYAADTDSEFYGPCRCYLESMRVRAAPTYLTWNVCYEFMRVSTHPRVFRNPWTASKAWNFLQALLQAPGFGQLTATDRHQAVLGEILDELPDLRGNLIHDLHTAVLMREHGISQICTRDTDFHRFPFVQVIDPLRVG